MARVHIVKKSNAGEPIKCGRGGCGAVIQPGEKYFWWQFYHAPKSFRCPLHPPKGSELCNNKLSTVYATNEGLEADISSCRAGTTSPGELASTLESAADDVESVRDEYQEGLDNMPDGLRDSQQDTQDKIDSLDTYASTLRDAASAIQDLESDGEETEDEDSINEQAAEQADAALGEFDL